MALELPHPSRDAESQVERAAQTSRPYSPSDRYRARRKAERPKRFNAAWTVAGATVLALVSWYGYVLMSPTGADTPDLRVRDEGQLATGAEAGEQAQADAPTARIADTPQNRELSQLLNRLASADLKTRQAAVGVLLQKPLLESRRKEVAGRLEKLLETDDPTLGLQALRALGRWGGDQNINAILRAIASSRRSEIRRAGIETLGLIGSVQSSRALATLMDDTPIEEIAALGKALRGAGARAEESAGLLLRHVSEVVRGEACDVLAQIGGTRSLRRLREIARRDSSRDVRAAASHALTRIETAADR